MAKVFNINAEAFIIPNSLEFNKKTGEVEVQLWFVAPESDDCYESDNICDHGVVLKDGSEDGLWVRPNAYFQMGSHQELHWEKGGRHRHRRCSSLGRPQESRQRGCDLAHGVYTESGILSLSSFRHVRRSAGQAHSELPLR